MSISVRRSCPGCIAEANTYGCMRGLRLASTDPAVMTPSCAEQLLKEWALCTCHPHGVRSPAEGFHPGTADCRMLLA